MVAGCSVVFSCDESGAKGYADQDEGYPGEVGVFAGILIPQEMEAQARPLFDALCDKYRPSLGKLHIAELSIENQSLLRDDVFSAIKELNLPCFWYGIHVAGLHDWYKTQRATIAAAKARAEAERESPPRIKRGSPRDTPPSLHVELFVGLYGHLVAFLLERDCKQTDVEVRTDRVDSPVVQEFEEVAKRLLSDDPELTAVSGWDTVTKKVVKGTLEVRLNVPETLVVSPVVRSVSINTTLLEDGYVLAADVLANSLNYLFKNRPPEEIYGPLNAPDVIIRHPLVDHLAAFNDWGAGDLIGDRLYRHPKFNAGETATEPPGVGGS